MSDKPKTYSEDEIPAKLSELGLDAWYLEGDWIRRKFNTDGWPSTLMAVNAVGYLCEAAGHHADLNVTWGKLWVKLATHSAGGITDKDFTLARKIEDTILWRPEDDSALDGPMGKFVFSKYAARVRALPARRRRPPRGRGRVPLVSNSFCTHASCSFIFGAPTASAPSLRVPSSSSRSSLLPTPSTPRGSAAE